MSKTAERLVKMRRKLSALKARTDKLEAAEKAREKKRDTRRKILLGAYVLEKANRDGSVEEWYRKMDGFLQRDSDRVLFGLEPWEKSKKQENAKSKQEK